jgi:1-deoxy-D-xylulose-5-phosphate synthase
VDASEVGSGLEAKRWRSGESRQVAIIGVGKMLGAALSAAELLADDGIEATVWDPRVVKPLDPAMLADAAAHGLVVTIEDGLRLGGIGSSIAAALGDSTVITLGVPDEYIAQAKPDVILSRLGLDGPGVAATVRAALNASTLA